MASFADRVNAICRRHLDQCSDVDVLPGSPTIRVQLRYPDNTVFECSFIEGAPIATIVKYVLESRWAAVASPPAVRLMITRPARKMLKLEDPIDRALHMTPLQVEICSPEAAFGDTDDAAQQAPAPATTWPASLSPPPPPNNTHHSFQDVERVMEVTGTSHGVAEEALRDTGNVEAAVSRILDSARETRAVLQEARPKGRATGGRTVGALVNHAQPAMRPLSTPLLREPATETHPWSQMLTFDMMPHTKGALIGSALGVVVVVLIVLFTGLS